ncbi:MAG: hypothetical protein ABH872_06625 [Candidatus Omnitrophota bacterium]
MKCCHCKESDLVEVMTKNGVLVDFKVVIAALLIGLGVFLMFV